MDTTTDRPTRARTLSIGAGLAAVLVLAAFVLWRIYGHGPEVPYDDPQAAGRLTLCTRDGEAVTSGKVTDRPFADVVLGQTGLPSDQEPTGAVATLFAYQPREGIAAGEFSGTPLTAATVLTDPARPAVAVTDEGWSIADFVTAFPADWDGYLQLRMYLGTTSAGTLTETPYDTADLRVDGDSWDLVRGGDASCGEAAGLLP